MNGINGHSLGDERAQASLETTFAPKPTAVQATKKFEENLTKRESGIKRNTNKFQSKTKSGGTLNNSLRSTLKMEKTTSLPPKFGLGIQNEGESNGQGTDSPRFNLID